MSNNLRSAALIGVDRFLWVGMGAGLLLFMMVTYIGRRFIVKKKLHLFFAGSHNSPSNREIQFPTGFVDFVYPLTGVRVLTQIWVLEHLPILLLGDMNNHHHW